MELFGTSLRSQVISGPTDHDKLRLHRFRLNKKINKYQLLSESNLCQLFTLEMK